MSGEAGGRDEPARQDPLQVSADDVPANFARVSLSRGGKIVDRTYPDSESVL